MSRQESEGARRPSPRRGEDDGGRPNRRQERWQDEAPAPKGGRLLLWPVAFAVVALLGVGGFALWRHFSAPEPVEIEQVEKRSPYVLDERQENKVERLLADLTLEQKVAQLFVVRPESITGVGQALAAGDATREALEKYPVGGICYFSQNLESPKQTREMIRNSQNYAKDICGLPLFACVDEEGGSVARVASNATFGVRDVGPMLDVGTTGDPEEAYDAARTIGSYLSDLGFNVDFAPVADIVTSEGSALYGRSFGTDAELVSKMVVAQVEGFSREGILSAAKHFPGIGAAEGDSHEGSIYSSRTVGQMRKWELVPFDAAIDARVPMIMVSHLSCLGLGEESSDLPASLSADVIQSLLRDEMGYDGLVITDSLEMGALDGVCEPDEQGVLAIQAGADLVLMPKDFEQAYRGLLGAVRSGRLQESRIDESVRRVIRAKLTL